MKEHRKSAPRVCYSPDPEAEALLMYSVPSGADVILNALAKSAVHARRAGKALSVLVIRSAVDATRPIFSGPNGRDAAMRLQMRAASILRNSDRLGMHDNQIVVVLEGSDLNGAWAAAKRLLRSLTAKQDVFGELAVGAAQLNDQDRDICHVIAAAKTELLAAASLLSPETA